MKIFSIDDKISIVKKSNPPAGGEKPAKKFKFSLTAELRDLFGRKVKKTREQGLLPANLYGKEIKSQALKVNLKDFLAVYKKARETIIIELMVGKSAKSQPVLIHNLQLHPVSDQPLHVDFQRIDLKKKVQVNIPIMLVGEAPGVNKGGVLIQLVNEVGVEALPTDLPEKFEIEINKLEEIGQSISIKELKTDKTKIKLLVDENQLVCKIEEPKKEEEEEKPAEAEVAAEAAAPTAEAGKEAPAQKAEPAQTKAGKEQKSKPEAKLSDQKKK